MAVVQKPTVVPKEKKPKSAPAHPPYLVMIQEAILALKERTGSSQYAIAKRIGEKQSSHLPQNFKKLLLVQLKQLVAKGKLVKVKNSFKLAPPALKTVKPAAPVAERKPKAATAAKPKTKAVKVKVPAAKLKVVAKPKAAKTASITSPGKRRVAKPKVVVKKPKSIKSPVKKVASRKTKK